MKSTDNFKMNKPEPTDYYDIEHFNKNTDIIDQELQENKEHRKDKQNPHEVDAKQLGLDKVDNTSDADKPVSTLQKQAIDDLKTADSATGENPTAGNSTDGNLIYLKNEGYTEQNSFSGKNKFGFGISAIDKTSEYRAGATQRLIMSSVDGNPNTVKCKYNGGNYSFGYIVIEGIDGTQSYKVSYTVSENTQGYTPRLYKDTSRSDENMLMLLVDGGNNETIVATTEYFVLSNIQVEKGAEATPFEEFCGGTQSPSPDYPQRISSNGDKGYFDGELLQGYYFKDDGVYKDNGKQQDICCKNPIAVNGNDKVEINYDGKTNAIRILYYDKSDTFISSNMIGTTSGTPTTSSAEFTAPSNCKYIRFNMYDAVSITPSTAKHISVTINGMYALRVNTTTDLLKLSKTNSLLANSDGSIATSVYPYAVVDVRDFDNVYIAGDFTLLNSSLIRVGLCTEYPKAGGKCVRQSWGENKSHDVSNYNYLLLTFVNSGTDEQIKNSFTLNVGTEQVPHQETTALIPVSAPLYDGDYIELYADGSGREYRENTGVVLNGSETITISGGAFSINVDNALNTQRRITSTHFKSIGSLSVVDNNTFISSQGNLIVCATSNFTLEEFKTWLAENKPQFIYKLATPTTTPLTAEQVAEFGKLQTFKGVTHVNADGEVTVRYYANTDSGETASKQIMSHIGMVIHSTTLDTMEKVISVYGGKAWEKIEGRFLLGQSDDYAISTEGGEEAHTLTIEELPSHSHNVSIASNTFETKAVAASSEAVTPISTMSGAVENTRSSQNVGEGQSHNNMPPYKVVYIWERTE